MYNQACIICGILASWMPGTFWQFVAVYVLFRHFFWKKSRFMSLFWQNVAIYALLGTFLGKMLWFVRFFRHIHYAHLQALFLGCQAPTTFMQACQGRFCENAHRHWHQLFACQWQWWPGDQVLSLTGFPSISSHPPYFSVPVFCKGLHLIDLAHLIYSPHIFCIFLTFSVYFNIFSVEIPHIIPYIFHIFHLFHIFPLLHSTFC